MQEEQWGQGHTLVKKSVEGQGHGMQFSGFDSSGQRIMGWTRMGVCIIYCLISLISLPLKDYNALNES